MSLNRSLKMTAAVVICFIIVLLLTSCSSAKNRENAEKQQKIIGVWIDDETTGVMQDDEGNNYVGLFEFTEDGRQVFHQVYSDATYSYPMDKYEIYDGNLKVFTKSGPQLAKISFEDIYMNLGSDTGFVKYRKLTDKEIETYNIVINQQFTEAQESEAETSASDSAMESSATTEAPETTTAVE